jgi:hypothetical protein
LAAYNAERVARLIVGVSKSNKPTTGRDDNSRHTVPVETVEWSGIWDPGKIGFDNPLGRSVAYQTSDIVDAKLLHDLLAMLLNGFDAEIQFRRDLFVGITFGNEL